MAIVLGVLVKVYVWICGKLKVVIGDEAEGSICNDDDDDVE